MQILKTKYIDDHAFERLIEAAELARAAKNHLYELMSDAAEKYRISRQTLEKAVYEARKNSSASTEPTNQPNEDESCAE